MQYCSAQKHFNDICPTLIFPILLPYTNSDCYAKMIVPHLVKAIYSGHIQCYDRQGLIVNTQKVYILPRVHNILPMVDSACTMNVLLECFDSGFHPIGLYY